MKPAEVRALYARARRLSVKLGQWAAASRNVPLSVHGVECNAHVKLRVWERREREVDRVDGECLVYLSADLGAGRLGACGWLRYSSATPLGPSCELLFECAFREAQARLLSLPDFLAHSERAALAGATTEAPGPTKPRPRLSL